MMTPELTQFLNGLSGREKVAVLNQLLIEILPQLDGPRSVHSDDGLLLGDVVPIRVCTTFPVMTEQRRAELKARPKRTRKGTQPVAG